MKIAPRRFIQLLFGSLVFCGASIPGLGSQSLSTPYVDVIALDVPLGALRSIQDAAGRDLILNNSSDQSMEVHVQVIKPQRNQLRGHAEPIPETNWISVEPADFLLAPRASATCQVRVLIPRDKRYRKRFYQAMIWSRARPAEKKGVTISVGLLSRVRLKTTNR